MATTREEIRKWFENPYEPNPTHMIVVCDTWDYEDYPVFVKQDEDVREVEKKYRDMDMSMVMEVYSYKLPLDLQLTERRAFHYD